MSIVPNIPDNDMIAAAAAAQVGAGSTEQVLSVTDVISEGPIQGLVFGGKSIFLNDDTLFSDSEIGITSTAGLSISSASPLSTSITLNNYKDAEFDYNPKAGQLGTRFLLIHHLYNFVNTAGTTTIAFNSSSGPSAANQQTGFELVLDGDFSSLPDAVETTRKEIRQSSFKDGDGIAEVWSESGDRYVTGMILSKDSTSIKIVLSTGNIENSSWIKTSGANLTVRVSELLKVSSISGNTITTTSNPSISFSNKSFSISEPVYTTNTGRGANYWQNRKYPSSGYQFRPGTVDQEPIESLNGDSGVSTVALPIASVGNLETAVARSITYTADSAAEIDGIRLIFRYSSGLFNLNKENGDKGSAAAAYVIRIFTQAADGTTFIDRGWYKGQKPVGDGLRKEFLLSTVQGPTLSISSESGATLNSSGLFVPIPDVVDTGSSADTILNINGANNIDVLNPEVTFISHGGKFLSGVTFTHTLNMKPYQPYSGFKIAIVRITHSENNTEDGKGRAHNWPGIGFRHSNNEYQGIHAGGISQAIGVITDRVHYPYTALANVTFNTRQFTSMPSRNYECYGMKVLVPSNYMTREEFGLINSSHSLRSDSESTGSLPDSHRLYGQHTYSDGTTSPGVFFTGSFRKEKVYTDNPAWVFYDILVNNRYGLGEFVKDIDIDIFSLYKVARYCDELVPDGNGGFEPRFRANLYLTKATDCYKVLKDMATMFRGMLYYMDGKLTTVMDEKRAPVYTFNKSNVIEGQFEYEQTGSKTRKNQIVVSWNNPQNEYKREPLFVEDRENIVKTGKVVKGKAVAFGCTSRGQAVRYGRWKLWTSINQTEVVAFKTAINAIFLTPGDVINVQDNHDYGFNYGGRVVNITRDSTTKVSTITLDRNLGETLDGTSIAQNIVSTDSPTFKLSLLLAEKTVILNEDHPSNPSLKRGDPITTWVDSDGNGILVNIGGSGAGGAWTDNDFEKFTSEAYVSAQGDLLNLSYTTATRVKEIECSTTESQILAGTSALTTTAPTGTNEGELSVSEVESALAAKIWALKDDANNPTQASYKEYKILSIVNDEDNLYNITAVEYYAEKFDSIETNFSPTLEDPLFPIDGPKSKLEAPRGLRIIRRPDMTKSGEEIVIEWTPPENDESVVGYEVVTGIPGRIESEVVNSTSLSVEGVPDGVYTILVRSKDARGRVSEPAIAEVRIEDFYSGNHPRIFGLLKGGVVNTRSVISTGPEQANKLFKFATNPVVLYSPTETKDTGQNVDAGGLDYSILSQYRSDSVAYPWWTQNTKNLLKDEVFVVIKNYSAAQSSRQLRLVNHVSDRKSSVDYWYDQTKQIEKSYNENEGLFNYPNNPDIWVDQQGTVTIDNESSKVEGSSNCNFTSLELTNVLKFSENRMARITFIESDTVMFIDRAFSHRTFTIDNIDIQANVNILYTTSEGHSFEVGDTVTITGATSQAGSVVNYSLAEITQVLPDLTDPTINTRFRINKTTIGAAFPNGATVTDAHTSIPFYKDELSLDFKKDFILGKLSHSGNFRSFLTIDPDITGIRDINVDSNVVFIRYDGQQTSKQLVDPITNSGPVYDNITLTVTAIAFDSPKFKVTGSSAFSVVSGSEDEDFTSGTDGVYTKTLDNGATFLGGNLDNSANVSFPLEFTVEVQETSDPTQNVTKVFSIIKVQDGSIGTSGKTVILDSTDYSIVYDEGGGLFPGNGSFNGNSVTITASGHNFTTENPAKFKITSTNSNLLTNDSNFNVKTSGDDASPIYEKTLTIPNTHFSTPATIKVEVVEGSSTNVVATDSISIHGVKSGAGGTAIVNSNNAHSITTDKFGNIGSGTTGLADKSGTTIEVFSGGKVLTYVGNTGAAGKANTSALGNNEWYIVSPIDNAGGDITLGSISVNSSTNIVTVGDHTIHNSTHASPMNNTEIITYTIRAKIGGVEDDFITKQTLSKSIAGREGSRTKNIYYRQNSETPPTPPSSAVYNFSSDSFISGLEGWVASQPSATSTEKFVFISSAAIDDPLNTGNTTIPFSEWGTVSKISTFATAGADAKAIKIRQSKNFVVYDENTPTTLQTAGDSVTFKIDIQGIDEDPQVVINTCTLKISVGGSQVAASQAINSAGNSPNQTFASQVQFTLSGSNLPTIANPVKDVRIELLEGGVEVAEDIQSIYAVKSGGDAIRPFLTNSQHVVPADKNGNLSSSQVSGTTSGTITSAGGQFRVLRANTVLNGSSFTGFSLPNGSANSGGDFIETKNGLRLFLDQGTGNYTLNVDAITAGTPDNRWLSNSESFTFRVTVDGIDYDQDYSIVKSIAGQDGTDAVFLTATPVSFSKNTTTNNFDPENTSTITLIHGDFDVGTVTYSSNNPSLLTVSGSGSSATGTFVSTGETSAKASATITASFTGGSRSIKIPTTVHGQIGTNGAATATGHIYFTTSNSTNPYQEGGSGVFNKTTGLVTSIDPSVGFSNNAPTINTTSGQHFWVAAYHGVEPASGNFDVTIQPAVSYFNFNGIVTFTNNSDGNAVLSEAGSGGGLTSIDGGNIATGSIDADRLQIGQTTGASRILLEDDVIKVFSGNASTPRIKIGNLNS